MNRTGAVAVAIAAASIALTGCTLTGSEVPPPTEAELAALNERVSDLQWRHLQFSPDSPRPTVEFERYVEPSDTDDVYRDCMQDAGYTDWEPTTMSAFGGPSSSERLDLYICVTRFPVSPSYYGLYSPAQLDAIYDYYRDSLVPCLRGAGLDVSDPPAREDFVESEYFAGQWSPYGYDFGLTETELRVVTAGCGDLSSVIGRSVPRE